MWSIFFYQKIFYFTLKNCRLFDQFSLIECFFHFTFTEDWLFWLIDLFSFWFYRKCTVEKRLTLFSIPRTRSWRTKSARRARIGKMSDAPRTWHRKRFSRGFATASTLSLKWNWLTVMKTRRISGFNNQNSSKTQEKNTVTVFAEINAPGASFLEAIKTISNPVKPIRFVYSPLWKITHQKPSVLCTPPFEKSLIKSHRSCVLPPLKITVFGGRLFRDGRLFRQIR